MKNNLNTLGAFIKKVFTHNRCDTCGFTKDEVYVTEYFMEAGIIQCVKCIEKSHNKCVICEKQIDAYELCIDCSKNNSPFDMDSDKHEYLGGTRI